MPNYRLSIERDKQIQEIDLLDLFSKYEYSPHDLLSLDSFTTKFENSAELKKYLVEIGILDNTEGNLCIVYRSKGDDKKLIYGVSYKRDKDFLKAGKLYAYITERIKDKDIEFLRRLIYKYQDSKIHENDMILIHNYIHAISYNKTTEASTNNLIEKMYYFICKEAYKYNNDTKSYELDENGNKIFTYRSFRDLGRLCSNYAHHAEEKEQEVIVTGKYKELKKDYKNIPAGQLKFI